MLQWCSTRACEMNKGSSKFTKLCMNRLLVYHDCRSDDRANSVVFHVAEALLLQRKASEGIGHRHPGPGCAHWMC